MTGARDAWDGELDERASPAPLLQTCGLGEVQSHAGWAVERVRLAGGAMASVQLRGLGPVREAYVPRGPVPASPDAIGALIDWARATKIARITVEPEAARDFGAVMSERGFKPAASVQPQHTRILKLAPPEQMLATFKHGRRYNIRAGERRGVVVEEGKDAAGLERQSAAVERRESISLPAKSYYQLLLDELPWCRTYVGRHPETREALSAVRVAGRDRPPYHLFAGRSAAHPGLMAHDLSLWAAIQAAAEECCQDYDL